VGWPTTRLLGRRTVSCHWLRVHTRKAHCLV